MISYKANYNCLRFQKGYNFSRGGEEVKLFPGKGVQMLISIETY